MHNKIKFIIILLAFGMMSNVHAVVIGYTTATDNPVNINLDFVNETDKKIEIAKTPRLENYNAFDKNPNYQFTRPDDAINPQQKTTASLSYSWSEKTYGASQFAYNYAGRSKDYGCFVTEIRFKGGAWFWNEWGYNVVIASYLQDPAYPNDYLMCTVERDPKDRIHFIVHLQSSAQDAQTDDSKRFVVVGDKDYLTSSASYGIDLPIVLNKKLFLYPNHQEPESTLPDARIVPSYAKHIKIINHTNETLVAGTPILDQERQFSQYYYIDQPQEIAPQDVTQSIAFASSQALQRFNYHIKGYAEESGCFISTDVANRDYAAFHFDANHPEKNLYCVIGKNQTVDIYDNLDAILPQLDQCGAETVIRHVEDCISYVKSQLYLYSYDTQFLHKFVRYQLNHHYNFYLDPVHELKVRSRW